MNVLSCECRTSYPGKKLSLKLLEKKLDKFLDKIINEGIKISEQINEEATPKIVTKDKSLSMLLLPSKRKRKGNAPIIVVPVVEKSTGMQRLITE